MMKIDNYHSSVKYLLLLNIKARQNKKHIEWQTIANQTNY